MKMKMAGLLNRKGSTLLFAVIAITAIAVLGTGIYFMTTTSTFSGISANDQNRAYQLAVAGKEYALVRNFENTASLYPSGRDFTFDNGDKIRLVIDGDAITSTGIVKEGTPYEARRTIKAKVTGFSSQSDVSFAKDIQSFTAPTQSQPGFITTNTATGEISLGKTTMTHSFGAVWYKGSAASGNCKDGKCDFGIGFRSFFVFKSLAPSSGDPGDGFTFAFFNGSNNISSSVGGYATSSVSSRGELLGYAGNSYSLGTCLDNNSCSGIQPPKIAIEFDEYYNACNSLCDGIGARDGSRCDEADSDPNLKNHMALVFWGENTGSNYCGTTVGKYTFDDNRHCSGGGSNETFSNASYPGQPAPCSYEKCHYFNGSTACTVSPFSRAGDWLINKTYALRIEVSRNRTAETSGNYKYRVKSWIKPCTSATCDEYTDGHDYTNTKKDYSVVGDHPTIDREIEMSPTYHERFETMFFGWTTATGGATLEVKIARFRMNFQK